jgi:phosphoglycolate phosphatase
MNPRELFDAAEALFLDFDGPIALLMPPPINEEAAATARTAIPDVDLPIEIASTTDHLAVLRWARVNCAPEVLRSVENACTDAEVLAAKTCDESPDAAALLDYAESRRIPVAIVSNNSVVAVSHFLARRDWQTRVATLACRTPETIDSLKPSPRLLLRASQDLDLSPEKALFVGDSTSDIHAARTANTSVLGIAKNRRRESELRAAGADAVFQRGLLGSVLL